MNSVRLRIIGVMAVVFEINANVINSDVSPITLERWDSLKHMNLIAALEEEFSIRFPDHLIEELTSLEFIENNVEKLLS